jgi:hypothetical protein
VRVGEVQFSNGTLGQGLLATKDLQDVVLPYVGNAITNDPSDVTTLEYGVSADFVNLLGTIITIPELSIDGDPKRITTVDQKWAAAAHINEASHPQKYNAVLHPNPVISRYILERAHKENILVITAFAVIDNAKRGEQVFLPYGSFGSYARQYEPAPHINQKYVGLFNSTYKTLETFVEDNISTKHLLVYPHSG